MVNGWKESDGVKEFKAYFSKQWCSPNRRGWYDHYCDWVPITNNSLESTNKQVKVEGTLRHRFGLLQFLCLLLDGFLRNWSTMRNPSDVNYIEFSLIPTMTLKEETIDCQWTKLNIQVKPIVISGDAYYCVASTDSKKAITEKEILSNFEATCSADLNSFKDYLSNVNKIRYFFGLFIN